MDDRPNDRPLAGGLTPATPVTRPASAATTATVRRYYDAVVSRRPPAERAAFLNGRAALAALGSAECGRLLGKLGRECRAAADLAPSVAWLDAYLNHGVPLPDGMVRAAVPTAIGGGEPARRMTPAPAVELEDLLDGLTRREAVLYDSPISPSALAFIVLGETGGKVHHARTHLGRRRRR